MTQGRCSLLMQDAVKVMAKSLIRNRHAVTKLYGLKSQLQAISLRIQVRAMQELYNSKRARQLQQQPAGFGATANRVPHAHGMGAATSCATHVLASTSPSPHAHPWKQLWILE